VQHLVDFFTHVVDNAGYPGLFVVMALGNLGIPVGTELVVPTAGALSATGHLSSVWLVGLIATAGELAGGYVMYAIGYYGGHPFLEKYGKYLFLRHHELERVHDFYGKYGAKCVFLCRFIPMVRGVAALPAGLSQMSARTFGLYTAAGSGIFCFGLALIGSAFGSHLDSIVPLLHRSATVVLVSAAVLIAGVVVAVRFRGARTA
jgi:membrane protein DedA with SNARE-associated domain